MSCVELWIGFIQTCMGAFAGAWIGYLLATREVRSNFIEERADILKALLNSLTKNVHYINQIENLHFPNNQIPTFPFDTVALAHITLHSRKYLPKGTNWAERYNELRFELDHINRKLLMYYSSPQTSELVAIKGLIAKVKIDLDSEIDTLSKVIDAN